jgi:cytoskeleton protein RodZ
MPLDTGGVTELEPKAETSAVAAPAEETAPTVATGSNIGQALRAVREAKGLSLEDVAEATRVRRAYLEAIEAMRLDALPSRPFTIGYIRAYANQLGLDGEAAVGRFRKDEPDTNNALPEPMGVETGRDPRLGLIGAGVAVVVAAIFIWNVAQRLLSHDKPEPSPVAATAPAAPAPAGNTTDAAVALGAPLPPPVESTTPPPYETPGLNEATAQGPAADGSTSVPAAPAPKPAAPPPNLAATFKPQGKIYGAAAAEGSGVILQALRPAALVVHRPDGSVQFARYFAAGESYRVPAAAGLSLDVPETDAFQIFAGGESKGVLATGSTSVSKLTANLPPPPRPATAAAPATRPATAAAAPTTAPAPRPAPVATPAPTAPAAAAPAPAPAAAPANP